MLPDPCGWHHPLTLGYGAWHAEAQRRANRGMKQRQCPTCKRWYWRDEWGVAPKGLGWASGEPEGVAS